MTTIYVDADACPVKAEIIKLAERHQVSAVFVSNTGFRTRGHPLLRSVLVPDGPDVADDWIASEAGAGDVVVTADIPLASRCLEKGALVVGPSGRESVGRWVRGSGGGGWSVDGHQGDHEPQCADYHGRLGEGTWRQLLMAPIVGTGGP